MKKTVIVYYSHYGATKKYAEFLQKALSCDLLENRRLKPEQLAQYSTVILGGGLYAGGISGLKLLTKQASFFADKNLAVFVSGLADPKNPENARRVRENFEKQFPPELLKKTAFFHLRGAIDYSRLSWLHRLMMGLMFRLISKKTETERTEEDRAFLETYGKSADFIDENAVKPIADYIKGL